MLKKISPRLIGLGPTSKIILLLIIVSAFSVLLFFVFKKKNTVNISQNIPKTKTRSLYVSGWLPYWKKSDGVDSIKDKLSLFSEINPFAFEVNADGSIHDTLQFNASPWSELSQSATHAGTSIVPTILWADPPAMHKIFSDDTLLANHVDVISQLLGKYNFSGVDIDYEGKDIADRDLFSKFLKTLREKIAPTGKKISCTVEPRTQDAPPEGWSGTQKMSYANDFSALNQFCDSVRIMAYDQVIQTHGFLKRFDDSSETLWAPNADNQWVEQVIQYALKYIPAKKISLGIPTYGWEFGYTKIDTGYHYERLQSVSYPKALEEAKSAGATPIRNVGGEMSFTYDDGTGSAIVTYPDAQSVAQKIALAKKYDLLGISIFKIDGMTDPDLFSSLQSAIQK